MLDDFGHEMDNTQSRLDNVMKKLAKVSHMTSGNLSSDTRQLCFYWTIVKVSTLEPLTVSVRFIDS